MISYKHKCIFIHIPRTGGSSVEKLIWKNKRDKNEKNLWMGFIDEFSNKYQTGGLQHLLGRQIRTEVGPQTYDQFYKFTIVRNPFDKIVSQYLYMSKRSDLRKYIDMPKGTSFKKYIELISIKQHVQWEPQHKFVLDENDEFIVDFIGRFESFEDDVRKILKQIGKNTTLFGLTKKKIPHLNKSIRKNYREYYDQETRHLVYEMYKKDFENFGYQF